MAIFDGSKATTAPLRRMTLYWESVGSVLAASGEPVSPVINLCCAVEDAAADGLATCIVLSPVEILYFLVSTTRPGDVVQFRRRRGLPEAGPASVGTHLAGASQGASGFTLGIKNYYILCSSAESTPIIVAWQNGRKRFFRFLGGLPKLPRNQSYTAPLWRFWTENPPLFHAIVYRRGGQLDASKVTRI